MTTEKRKPRVLMTIAKFFPAVGGTENQALLLARALMHKGVEVTVLTRRVPDLPETEYVSGIRVSRSIRVIDRGKLFGVTYFFSCLSYFVARRRQFDIIHCHILHGFHSLAAVLMKTLFGKKVIIKVASSGTLSDFMMLRRSLCGPLILGCLTCADRVIALSRRSADEARVHGFSDTQIAVIPNGADTKRFRPMRPCQETKKRIVCAGSLSATKGIDVLMDACFLLKRTRSEFVVDIFGSGPLHDRLREKSIQLGLEGCVRFHGSVPDIERHFDSACIFVQPSLVEGMSNVILEAMAAGLPVVATRTGASAEVIQDGVNGFLVDPGSAQQIHDAVLRLLCDESLAERIGRQARAAIQEAYSIEAVADKYVELYQGLLDPAVESCARKVII